MSTGTLSGVWFHFGGSGRPGVPLAGGILAHIEFYDAEFYDAP